MNFVFRLCGALTLTALGAACGDDGDDSPNPADAGVADTGSRDTGPADTGPSDTGGSACRLGTLPDRYPADGFPAMEAAEVLTRFGALRTLMTTAENDITVTRTEMELVEAFNAGGMTSLSSLTTPSHRDRTLALLSDFASATGQTWVPAEPPPAVGGRYGGDEPAPPAYWIFTGDGIDIRQVWEKGSFGAMMYHRSQQLAAGTVTPATIDNIVTYFGAQPRNSAPPFDRDQAQWSASYTKRRTAPDSEGMLTTMESVAIRARAAAGVGAECEAELRSALAEFFRVWEESQFATIVYYAAAARRNLENANPTPKQLASAAHAIGEGIGFAVGFRELPAAQRVISDAQIDTILDIFGNRPNRTVTTYEFVTNPAGTRGLLDTVATTVGPIYGFSGDELRDFETNY